MDIENRRKKLKYNAWHRGTKECDLLLGPFADAYIGEYDEQQLAEFEDILNEVDVDLYAWITTSTIPEFLENNTVYKTILQFHSS